MALPRFLLARSKNKVACECPDADRADFDALHENYGVNRDFGGGGAGGMERGAFGGTMPISPGLKLDMSIGADGRGIGPPSVIGLNSGNGERYPC